MSSINRIHECFQKSNFKKLILVELLRRPPPQLGRAGYIPAFDKIQPKKLAAPHADIYSPKEKI